ncbi:MAG TPA: bacillithiol biosynthesis deacetylase BshB1 [Longimicrobiales bacterium]|nr:bacillithiol biosynthesis deacetylase BshB1 [Longimicrobiales bacterium]
MDHDGLHLLALCAHPDDAELLCGGTLLRTAKQGYRTGVLDLTAGETGSYGTPEIRAREAARAAEILGVAERRGAGLPDGALQNTVESRRAVAGHIRALRPRVVILQADDARHPDHRVGAELARDACFLAGLANAPLEGAPYRPHKIVYGQAYREAAPPPTFVVDISAEMEGKLEAIFAYASQFEGKSAIGSVRGGERPLREQLLAHHAHYGSLIRRPYGEPFWTPETVRVDDLVALEPRSM